MKAKYVITMALLAGSLGGCAWMKENLWPWGRQEGPPVIRPSHVDAVPPGWRDEPELAARPPAEPPPEPPAVPPAEPPAEPPPERPRPPAEGTDRQDKGPDVGVTEVVAASMLQVNNRFITVDDVLDALDPQLRDLPKDISRDTFGVQAGRMIADRVRRMVSELLILAEAEKRLPSDQADRIEQEVSETLAAMIVEAGGSKSKLQADLAREGKTLEKVLDAYRRELKVRIYLRMRFTPSISVNRRMLWSYYRAHLDEFSQARKVQMQLIAAPFRAFMPEAADRPTGLERTAARAVARKQIDRAVAALRDAREFGEVARELSKGIKASEGGLWPAMEINSFREAKVEAAAFAMSEGQVSGVIEADSGYYIVRVRKILPGTVVSFEEAQERIEQILRDEQYRKLSDEYFSRLLGGATIVQSDRFIQLAVARATEKYWRE